MEGPARGAMSSRVPCRSMLRWRRATCATALVCTVLLHAPLLEATSASKNATTVAKKSIGPSTVRVQAMSASTHGEALTTSAVYSFATAVGDYTAVLAAEYDKSSRALRAISQALVQSKLGDDTQQEAAKAAFKAAKALPPPAEVNSSALAVQEASAGIAALPSSDDLEQTIKNVVASELARLFTKAHPDVSEALLESDVVEGRAQGREAQVNNLDPRFVEVAAAGATPVRVLTGRAMRPLATALVDFGKGYTTRAALLEKVYKALDTAFRNQGTGGAALESGMEKLFRRLDGSARRAEALAEASSNLAQLAGGTAGNGGGSPTSGDVAGDRGTKEVDKAAGRDAVGGDAGGGNGENDASATSLAEVADIRRSSAVSDLSVVPEVFQAKEVEALTPFATKDFAKATENFALERAEAGKAGARVIHQMYDRFKALLKTDTPERVEVANRLESVVLPLSQAATWAEERTGTKGAALAQASVALVKLAEPTYGGRHAATSAPTAAAFVEVDTGAAVLPLEASEHSRVRPHSMIEEDVGWQGAVGVMRREGRT